MHTDSTDFIRNARRHDSLGDAKGTYGRIACVECNISELIVMTRYFPLIETHIVLRTMLSAGVLAVLLVLACAGTAAGATTWVVDDDGGAACVGMQIVEAAA
jgi:hypothetical protein